MGLEQGSRGPEVEELKQLLTRWGVKHPLPKPLAPGPVFGDAVAAAIKALQRKNGLKATGKVGAKEWALLDPKGHPESKQDPALPGKFSHAAVPPYVQAAGWMGMQPWIVPQVKAICNHFGLQVTAGFGGHPPHAVGSDHGWGGGVDLAGPMDKMVACNLWADRYCADPHRKDMVFRWVGGPAKDSNGVEPGHTTHVHLSWYRGGPATSIFDTPEFR
jgi:hypothetical protein